MKRTLFFVGLVMLVAVWFGLAAHPVQAADVKVGLLPGQSATIPMSYWCLDYGKPFPAAIDQPGDRAQDEVVAVLQAAIENGAVVSDTYQTNLAIWRVRTGEFKDFAKRGSALAEEIYSNSLKITVEPIGADSLTLTEAVKQGKITVQVTNFTTLPVEGVPGHPFHGTADVVVTNVTTEPVEFTFYEGTVFAPANDEDAQNLLAHLDPQKQPQLPELPKAGASFEERNLTLAIVTAFGLLVAALGAFLVWRSYNPARA